MRCIVDLSYMEAAKPYPSLLTLNSQLPTPNPTSPARESMNQATPTTSSAY